MIHRFKNKFFTYFVAFIFSSFNVTSFSKEIPTTASETTVKEYTAPNPEGRPLIHVQIWGHVPLSGLHHIPDNANLIDLIGYAGGPSGSLLNAKISVRRGQDNDFETLDISGRDLLEKPSSDYRMHNSDIVNIDIEQAGKSSYLRDATVISAILGLVMTVIAAYFLINERS